MNKEEMKIEDNRRKFLTPQTQNSARPKNGIFINTINSYSHELTKCIICLMYAKKRDYYLSDELKKEITKICSMIEDVMENFPKQRGSFVTEAIPSDDMYRRVDIVLLDGKPTYVEVETDHKIKKDKCITEYI